MRVLERVLHAAHRALSHIRYRSAGVRLHLARNFQDGDRRMIMLATTRPIGPVEAVRGTRSLDYDLTMLQLEFDDPDSDGTGTFIVGADIKINPDTHKLQIEFGSTEPVRITNLKKQN